MNWPSTFVDALELSYNKKECSIQLEDKSLLIVTKDTGKVDVILIADLIGAKAEAKDESSSTITLFAYPQKPCRFYGNISFQPRHAHHRTLTVNNDSNPSKLVDALRHLATGITKERKLLVVVNPKSGPKRNAASVAENTVLPILEQAHCDCEVRTTMYADHAREIAGEVNLKDFDGIVLLGGDGIIHETLNGMPNTRDIPIGIIGCGTSNGVASSLTHARNEPHGVLSNALRIAKNSIREASISEIVIDGEHKYLSMLTFAWGIIAEIDIESELLRCLGSTRYDIWGVLRTATLRRYPAKLTYSQSTDITDNPTTIESNFVLIWASNVSHAGRTTHHCPSSRFDDDFITVLVIRYPISRFQVARILLGLDDGSHAELRGIEWIRCKSYKLEAEPTDSYNNVDGEKAKTGTVVAKVLPKAVRYFG